MAGRGGLRFGFGRGLALRSPLYHWLPLWLGGRWLRWRFGFRFGSRGGFLGAAFGFGFGLGVTFARALVTLRAFPEESPWDSATGGRGATLSSLSCLLHTLCSASSAPSSTIPLPSPSDLLASPLHHHL